MARTEEAFHSNLTLRELRAVDVEAAFALSEEAGWNQTREDWSMLIRLGRAFGMADSDGRLVATALAVPYPPRFGWIAMVLVHGPLRRRGLGTRLLERSISELETRRLVAFLDATPAGRAVYERMGFRPVEALTRWQGGGGGQGAPAAVADAEAVAALDRAAFGADRSEIVRDLLGRPGALALASGSDGFLLSRTGRTATYIGPFVARDSTTALRLLDQGLAAISGPVLLDVPDRETEIAELLARRGFRAQRPFTRMALGRDTGFGNPALVRAIAAPELG